MDFTSLIQQFSNSPAATQAGEKLGLDKQQVGDATAQLLPTALGLIKKLRDNEGEEQAANALGQIAIDPDGDDAANKAMAQPNEQINALLGGGGGDLLGSLAGKILGGGQGNSSGASNQNQLAGTLMPLILGFLQKQGGNSGGSGKGGILGTINTLLDQDGDGSALDDIAAKVLGGGSSSQQKQAGGGFLGKIFGGLLGGKK